jgi:hypothetical protein
VAHVPKRWNRLLAGRSVQAAGYVAGHEDDALRRTVRQDPIGELGPVHPWYHHITEHQVQGATVPAQGLVRLGTALRLQHGIAERLELPPRESTHRSIVI